VRVSSFRKLAVATLIATLGVILWGAYVRASGSGAGCGSHWPTCNGEIVPRPKSVATIIEFTHRITSGLSLLLVVAQLVGAFRAFPKGHVVRRGAAATMFFMVTEAAVGAGLVLFEMVAGNKSAARAIWMGAHLANTFFLLASMALTLWWSFDRPAPKLRGPRLAVAGGAGFALLLVGMAGAIVALGDTLFPVKTLAEGIAQDLTPGAHFLVRLRAVHPAIAVLVGAVLVVLTKTAAKGDRELERLATIVNGVFYAQVAIGFVNLVLLAPTPLQLVHLLVADLYWIAAVVFGAAWLARPAESPATQQAAAATG
jgi:heme A synthase